MKKQLNEAQAWTRIARDIEKGKWRGTGLCNEISRLRSMELTSPDTLFSMQLRIDRHSAVTPHFDGGYVWFRGEAEPRILAANFLALEAADEAKASR